MLNKHYTTLFLTCLIALNVVVFAVFSLLKIADKISHEWFASINQYGIASTFLYSMIIISIFFYILEYENKKKEINIGDSISCTDLKWNNEMSFSCNTRNKIFFSFSNLLKKEKLRKKFFNKNSGERDFVEILSIYELYLIFFRFTLIKFRYNRDIT